MDGADDHPHGAVSAPLVLVDPPRGPFWPLAATRPVADLLAGSRSFERRWADRASGVATVWCDEAVAGAPGPEGARAPRNRWPDPDGGLRVALASWVPPSDWTFGEEPVEWRLDDRPVAWRLDPGAAAAVVGNGSPEALPGRLADLGLPAREAGGTVCLSIWEVVAANPALHAADADAFAGESSVSGVDPFVLLGEAADLRVGGGVRVGPFVVLDARGGPVVLDRQARIEPGSILRGPVYVGPGSVVLGGEVGRGTSIGPWCRVRGEVEQSIFQGYANKAHEGFVGHSAIGEWANLGAGTTTSDLKNTYGTIRVEGADDGDRIETGLAKVGAFLGDHVKTGIGTLLATGARIGVGSHLFGGRAVAPGRLPDFSWYDGRDRRAVEWDAFERTARLVMARRDRELGDAERKVLRALHRASA